MSQVVEQMIASYYQTNRFSLYEGDCLALLPMFAENSFDSIVTDPPAGISFMGKDWDHNKGGRDAWVAWMTSVMRECLRVLKPGGHALVWAIPRTSHWTGWAIESAGFDVRDRVSHLFGSGFPKSLDISKALDAAAGAKRERVGSKIELGVWNSKKGQPGQNEGWQRPWMQDEDSDAYHVSLPATEAAKQWNGWGTALKPACEDWWLARKPFDGTVAQNILEHGTGGLNIDGCRIEGPLPHHNYGRTSAASAFAGKSEVPINTPDAGRWPANVIHDGSEEVLAGFPEVTSGTYNGIRNEDKFRSTYSEFKGTAVEKRHEGSSGSAARFFYCAKSSQDDRNEGCEDLPHRVADNGHKRPRTELDDPRRHGVTPRQNNHPTVKPTELMRYLCRLITPPGGVVLDPFCGSGSTGKAAMLEGLKFIGVELNAEYCQLAQRRIEAVTKQGLLFA